MVERAVRQSRKDSNGNIVGLGDTGAAWSVRSSVNVIADIDSRLYRYYVPWLSGRTEITVVNGPTGRYLRTDRDRTLKNNLDDLPDC